jgi:hypothetical protein
MFPVTGFQFENALTRNLQLGTGNNLKPFKLREEEASFNFCISI